MLAGEVSNLLPVTPTSTLIKVTIFLGKELNLDRVRVSCVYGSFVFFYLENFFNFFVCGCT